MWSFSACLNSILVGPLGMYVIDLVHGICVHVLRGMGFVVGHLILVLGNIVQAAGLQLLIAPAGPHALFKHRSVGGHKLITDRAEAITSTPYT